MSTPSARPSHRGRSARGAALLAAALVLGGCALFAQPKPPGVTVAALAQPGPVGYVVCANAVTPVELSTGTAEADIDLPISGSPALGDYAIATSPDGRWAYVDTSDALSGASPTPTSAVPVTTGVAPGQVGPVVTNPPRNVVIPIDLTTQRADPPILLPGSGGTHGIAVSADGRTVWAASGTDVVPITAATRAVGAPVSLGRSYPVFGLVLNPSGTVLYALVPDGVFPVDTSTGAVGSPYVTDLSVSSVNSPHGIVVSADGSTVYVVGQGGSNYGGRVAAITIATGVVGPVGSFDADGISSPAALALTADGKTVLVLDAPNDWVTPVPVATLQPFPPIKVPARSGNEHPTDIVTAPGGVAYIVDGFASLVPFHPGPQTFDTPIPVCSGAASMAIAEAP